MNQPSFPAAVNFTVLPTRLHHRSASQIPQTTPVFYFSVHGQWKQWAVLQDFWLVVLLSDARASTSFTQA
jgi:hypothetical protein